jgi:hypothetical protein
MTKNGIKPISAVSLNDFVLTDKKRYQKPIATHKRNFNGKIVQLYPFYSNIPISLSKDHPVFAVSVKGCEIKAWKKTKCLPYCQGKGYVRCTVPFKKYKPEWVPSGCLKKWDAVAYLRVRNPGKNIKLKLSEFIDKPFNLKGGKISIGKSHKLSNIIKVDKNFARLVGYYVAEGEAGEDYVCFNLHSKEREIEQDLINLMKKVTGINSYSKRELEGEQGMKITFCSKMLVSFFKRLFSAGAPNKCLPEWFIDLKTPVLNEFIKGYYLGDGRTKQGGKRYVYTMSTVSKKLAYQLQQIFHKLGIMCGINIHSKKGEKHKWKERVIERKYDRYMLYIPAWYRKKLTSILELPYHKTRMMRSFGWVDKKYVYICLREVKQIPYQGKLYNLGMNDETYTAEGVIVHNCGGTFKNGHIELQGDHRNRLKEILLKLGYEEKQIEIS